MDDKCPKTEKCPLFQGEILVSSVAQEIYMDLYCYKGPERREKCKRFQLSKHLDGPVSLDVMPNDKREMSELISIYKQ